MKICIVGGVAGGASAATRLRRLSEDADIVLFEKGDYISYECFILGKHTARNGVAGISPPRREFQKC